MNSTAISQAKTRLLNDFKHFMDAGDNETVMGSPREDNLFVWDCVILGPEDSPWEGGCFKLTMNFTNNYPKEPPSVIMNTKVFHPNFYNDGRICLDILKNQWSPIFDVHSLLISIQSLLTDPNPNSPANAEAAALYRDNIQLYYKKVKECVEESLKGE